MVLGSVEETITIVDVNEDTYQEVIRVCVRKKNSRVLATYLQLFIDR
jgi:hypothetical protein